MKNKLFYLTILTLSLIVLILPVKAETKYKSIIVSEDSWIASASPDSNYGSSDQMQICYPWNPIDSIDKAWLNFSLGSLESGATILDAKVYMYTAGEASGESKIDIHYSSNDTWTEATITWNNAPDYNSTILDSVTLPTISGTEWYSWTVTSAVQTEYEGDKKISFCLKTSTECTASTWVSSEGSSGYRPYLKISYFCEEEDGNGNGNGNPDINILDVPYQFGTKLGISTDSAGVILSALFLFPVSMILLLWKKGGIIALILNLAILGFFTSITWLPIWITILIAIVVVALQGLKMRNVF